MYTTRWETIKKKPNWTICNYLKNSWQYPSNRIISDKYFKSLWENKYDSEQLRQSLVLQIQYVSRE